MVTLTITHADGSTETIAETVGWSRKRVVGEMRRVTIEVERSLAEAVTLTPKVDDIDLGSIDTVRLVDIETGGSTWTLICYSAEWLANQEAPTVGGDERTGDDQAIINGLIGEVDAWTAGTVNSFTGSLSFVFNHAHRHEAIRRVERNVPGEVQFRDGGTVDYLDRLGSDKSGSVTLSASEANIEKRIRITNRGRELDGTHIRVLGAHEGEAQIFANLVPDGDTTAQNNLDNVVTYTTSRWSDDSDTDWDRWANKDVTDQDTIEAEAAALGAEITEDLVEAETTVPNSLGLAVGDTVHVEKSDADLDRDMRVHRIVTKAGSMNSTESGAAVVDELLLTTRTTVRKGDAQDLEDIQRFNTAFQGSAVWGTPSGGYQAVTSSENYRLTFFYPDVAFEHTAELYVESQPYRTFHSGAAASETGEVLNPATRQFSVGTSIDTSQSNQNVFAQIPQPISGTFDGVIVSHGLLNETGAEDDYTLQLEYQYNDFNNRDVLTTDTVTVGDNESTTFNYRASASEVDAGEYMVAYVTDGILGTESGNEDLGQHYIYVETVSKHTHAVDPGVSEFPGETASGVDVIVNGGSPVATDIGSGAFETTVDISGELTKGAFNTVELTSDSTGWLFASAGLEAYRQIGSV